MATHYVRCSTGLAIIGHLQHLTQLRLGHNLPYNAKIVEVLNANDAFPKLRKLGTFEHPSIFWYGIID